MTDQVDNATARRLRWAVTALVLVAAGLYVVSYFLAYWKMTLHAPQYPDGLYVDIFLTHLEGDVREIDGLNHYIGMRSLQEAAVVERAIAGWAMAAMGLALVIFAVIPRVRFAWVLLAPGLLFPVVFVVDIYYWLYIFGNYLDPTAPLEFEPFTPTLLGEGIIGQFRTVAAPAAGYYLALSAAALLLAALWLRGRMCRASSSGGEDTS